MQRFVLLTSLDLALSLAASPSYPHSNLAHAFLTVQGHVANARRLFWSPVPIGDSTTPASIEESALNAPGRLPPSTKGIICSDPPFTLLLSNLRPRFDLSFIPPRRRTGTRTASFNLFPNSTLTRFESILTHHSWVPLLLS